MCLNGLQNKDCLKMCSIRIAIKVRSWEAYAFKKYEQRHTRLSNSLHFKPYEFMLLRF